MTRKKFVLNLPFRQITKSDAKKQFENELFELNRIALADLISANKKNWHVFVYDRNGDILAFLAFKDVGRTIRKLKEQATTRPSFNSKDKI